MVGILSSLNIIGLVAFLITLGFLIYEVFTLSKGKKGESKPYIPKFEEGAQPLPPSLQIKESGWKNLLNNLNRNNKIVLITLTVLVIIFGALTLVGGFSQSSAPPRQTGGISPTRTLVRNVSPTIEEPAVVEEQQEPTIFVDSIPPTEIAELEPTEEVIAAEEDIPAVSEVIEESDLSPTEEVVEELSLSPTTSLDELPVTSYVNNSLVLFAVSAMFLFFAFLF